MKYEITFINQLKSLSLLVFITILTIIVVSYYYINDILDENLKFGFIFFTLINFLPVIYLHLEYYFYNRGKILEIDPNQKIFSLTYESSEIEQFSFNEIAKVVLYMPPHFHSNKLFLRIPFDNYHYAKFYTTNGNEIIITSLMVPKIEDIVFLIKGITVEKKKRIIASIILS